MKLYLVRHAETSANVRGLYCGVSDLSLTEMGIEQALSLAKLFADCHFDQLIYSGLVRTQQTAKVIIGQRQIEQQAIAAFDEINFGDWELRHYSEIAKNDRENYRRWCDDWINVAPPKGEKFSQFKQRVLLAFGELLQGHQGQDLLLVLHQGTLRAIMLSLLQMPDIGFWQFNFHQGAYSLIEINHDHAVVERINALSIG